MKVIVRVAEIMTSPAVTVTANTSIRDLCRILQEHDLAGCPVVDDEGHPVGFVSQKDVLRDHLVRTSIGLAHTDIYDLFSPAFDSEDILPHPRRPVWVEEIMSRPPLTVAPETPVPRAAGLILEKHIHRLPVVEGGKVVGIVSTSDIVRLMAEPQGGT